MYDRQYDKKSTPDDHDFTIDEVPAVYCSPNDQWFHAEIREEKDFFSIMKNITMTKIVERSTPVACMYSLKEKIWQPKCKVFGRHLDNTLDQQYKTD